MAEPRNDERDGSMPLMAWTSFATTQLIKVMRPTVASIAEFNGKTILGWMALQREWTGFLMHRVQEEVALANRLAKCSCPRDMYSVCAEFQQQAFTDYQREFAEMLRLGQSSLSEATSSAQNAIEVATRDTLRAAA